MSFRTVVITKHCKCTYRNDYLLVRDTSMMMVHLSEIHTIVFESPAISLTVFLLCELLKWKINIIFCDDKHNPVGEILPLYANYHTVKRINEQIVWSEENNKLVWTRIVYEKILRQSQLLRLLNKDGCDKLESYLLELEFDDASNREGHAAKVYFSSLFGKDFYRDSDNPINAALDYGYSLILSAVNKEVVATGFLTQLGISHCNEFNEYNLSCDLMEPFRPLVDEVVYKMDLKDFSREIKYQLLDIFNIQVSLAGSKYYLSNAISDYVKSTLKCITTGNINDMKFYNYHEN